MPRKSNVLFQEHNLLRTDQFISFLNLIDFDVRSPADMAATVINIDTNFPRCWSPEFQGGMSRDKRFLSFANGMSKRNITIAPKVTEASLILKCHIHNIRNNRNFILIAQIIFNLLILINHLRWDLLPNNFVKTTKGREVTM